MNDSCIRTSSGEDPCIEELIKKIEKKWFDTSKAVCKYVRLKNSAVILESGNPLFFEIMKLPRTACGKDIFDILPRTRAEYIKMLMDSFGNDSSVFRYVRETSDGSRILEISAVCRSNVMYCIAEPMISCDLLIKTADSSENGLYDNPLSFTGTLIAYKNSDGRMLIESCSDSLSSHAPDICTGADLGDILKKYMCRICTTRLINECIEKNQPMRYYDMTVIKTSYCTPLHPLGILRVSMLPIIGTADAPKAVITVSTVRTGDFSASQRHDSSGEHPAVFLARRSDSNEIYIEKMSLKLALMLADGEVLYEDICSCCTENFDSTVGDNVVRNCIITGRDSAEYAVNLVPGYAADRSKGVLGTVKPRPKTAGQQLLTARENEILSLAAAGNSNRYIALHLKISEGTVKKILHNGYTKLGIGSRVELVKLFDSEKDMKDI